MISRRRFLTLAAASAAAPAFGAAPLRWHGTALGAQASITLYGPPAEAGAALAQARAAIARIEMLFSLYRADSALVALNTHHVLDPVPEAFAALMTLVDRTHGATQGRFDPTVQPLWQALAAGQDGAAARALIGWHRVGRGARITLEPGMALTFNGIAQGFATDVVADLLAAAGFTRQLVDIGELRAGEGAWNIGLADPALGVFSTFKASRTAFATSSPGALPLPGGHSHILSPQGEAPVWSSVVVEAERAAEADALSTAFCLMGKAQIAALVPRWPGLRSVTLVDARGEIATL